MKEPLGVRLFSVGLPARSCRIVQGFWAMSYKTMSNNTCQMLLHCTGAVTLAIVVFKELRGESPLILLTDLIITGRNEVLAKVIILHLSVILLTVGVSKFFFGGGSPIFLGGLQFFGGVSNFLRGSPIFLGGLQIFRGGFSNFLGGLQFFGGGVWSRNTVNVRPVRILLECILVLVCFCTTSIGAPRRLAPSTGNPEAQSYVVCVFGCDSI